MKEKLSVHELRYRMDNPMKRRDVLFYKEPPKVKAVTFEELEKRRREQLKPKKQGLSPWTKG